MNLRKPEPPKARHKLMCEIHIACLVCKSTTCAVNLSDAGGPYPVYGCLVCDNLLYKKK